MKRRRLGIGLLILVLSVFACGLLCAQSYQPLARWGVSVTGTETFKYWRNDAAVHGLLNNYQNLLDLVFVKGDVTVGVEFNHANFFPANPEIPTSRINGVRKVYLELRTPNTQVTLGDFYASFGKGLVLSVTKDEAQYQDRTIIGSMGSFNFDKIRFKVLGGVADQELTGEKESIVATEVILPKIRKFEPALRYSFADDYNKVIVDGARHTGSIGVNAVSLWGFLDFNAEMAYMWHESTARNGHAVYLGTNMYKGRWSMLVEYKDYFRFNNNFNNPPLADLDDAEALLDDIFGLYIKNIYNWRRINSDIYGSFGYYTYWHAPKDAYQYFAGIIKPDLFGRLYLQAEYGQRRELQTIHKALINADLTLTGKYSLQYMLEGKTRRSDLGSLSEWNTSVTLSRASLFALTYMREFGNRQAIGQTSFQSVKVDVDITNSWRASVNYGSSRGGLICSGGICRFEPPFKGTKIGMEYKF
jgi:hypothetical protein